MATFKIEKGSKFQIDKGIRNIEIGLGWDAQDGVDLDGSVFGLVHLPNGAPSFYGEGSHAVCYANNESKQPDKTIHSLDPKTGKSDGAIIHSGDARQGGGGGAADEVISVHFDKMPAEIVELAVWITIYDALKRNHDFSHVHKSFLQITDKDNPGAPIAQYDLGKEFGNSKALQVGSFIKGADNVWSFSAIGAGSNVEIGAILQQYS